MQKERKKENAKINETIFFAVLYCPVSSINSQTIYACFVYRSLEVLIEMQGERTRTKILPLLKLLTFSSICAIYCENIK